MPCPLNRHRDSSVTAHIIPLGLFPPRQLMIFLNRSTMPASKNHSGQRTADRCIDRNGANDVEFDPCLNTRTEVPMNNPKINFAFAIAALVSPFFCPATTHAQAETGAQEHQSANMAPASAVAMKTDFEGHVEIPFEVQCHGHKIVPGKYTLLVKTVGENKMVTLEREGTDVVLESRPVPPTSTPDEGHSAILVRHGPGPGTHTIEGVYLESLKLVLFLDESGHTKPLDKIFATVKRVPIT
jgi:hypothetical protein